MVASKLFINESTGQELNEDELMAIFSLISQLLLESNNKFNLSRIKVTRIA